MLPHVMVLHCAHAAPVQPAYAALPTLPLPPPIPTPSLSRPSSLPSPDHLRDTYPDPPPRPTPASAGHETPVLTYLALGGSFVSYIYSAPPLKLKQSGWAGNYALGSSYISLPWWAGQALFGTLTLDVVDVDSTPQAPTSVVTCTIKCSPADQCATEDAEGKVVFKPGAKVAKAKLLAIVDYVDDGNQNVSLRLPCSLWTGIGAATNYSHRSHSERSQASRHEARVCVCARVCACVCV